MIASDVRVPTANASKYLQQLCKHWAHNLDVTFTPHQGRVVFPRNARGADWPGDAVLELAADGESLDAHLSASAPGQLAALKDAVVRHVERFAFKEMLAFNWRDNAG
jgi:hypothetical protein